MTTNELTPAQKRKEVANRIYQKYGQYWLVYAALAFTATLSFISGLILPFTPDASGILVVTVGGIFAAIYYSVGFVTNGEAAANYWFDKLTDHDKDNTPQKVVATVMLVISIAVSLTTALAAAAEIAFLLGVLDEFTQFPSWAQEWIVWSIPTMWTVNAVAGMAFKAMSDEAAAERNANAIIREAKQTINKARIDAKANYWKVNAPEIARRLGVMEAEKEIADYAVRLSKPTPQPAANAAPANAVYASAVEDHLADMTVNPTDG